MIEAPDFLPLGSVVTLEGSPKKFMILSRALAVEISEGEKRYYDYGLALLPHGLVGDAVVYTNHDRISSVVFEGYSDEDDVALMATIEEVLPLMDIEKGDTEPQIDTW